MNMQMTFSDRLNPKLTRIRGEQLIMMIHIKSTPHVSVVQVILEIYYEQNIG